MNTCMQTLTTVVEQFIEEVEESSLSQNMIELYRTLGIEP